MRLLTPREQATICAALRLWIDTPGDAIPESVFAGGAGDEPPLQDADAERLLQLLASPAFGLELQSRPVWLDHRSGQ